MDICHDIIAVMTVDWQHRDTLESLLTLSLFTDSAQIERVSPRVPQTV